MSLETLKIIKKDQFRQNLNKYTCKAFYTLPRMDNPKILDVGCGTGVPTMELVRISNGEILATDIDQDALDLLDEKIKDNRLEDRVKTMNLSLFDLDLLDETFDIIWSEGSIFAIGFQKGLEDWRHLIKDTGFIVVHDPFQDHNLKLVAIEKCGYELLDCFLIDHQVWWFNFYQPYEKHIKYLQEKYIDNHQVQQALEYEKNEIKMFKKDPESFSSIFYVIQKK